MDRCTSEKIVVVNKECYKPFWFDKHMYFVNVINGKLYKLIPIYLQDRDYATLSDLKNYFNENNIQILIIKDLVFE